jgi:hypothetical protein
MSQAKDSKAQHVQRLCVSFLKAIFILTIPTYYLWSGIIYMASAITIVLVRPHLKEFLCDIYTHPDTCDDCPSTLLMCEKDACYRNAMNITMLTEAATVKGDYFSSFSKASLDSGCNNIIKDSKNPVDALMRMYNAYSPSATAEQSPCIQFHCGVLLTALTHVDLVNTVGSDVSSGCTNTRGSKQKDRASDCVCSSVWSNLYEEYDLVAGGTSTFAALYQSTCGEKMPTTSTSLTTTTTTDTSAASSRLLLGNRLIQNQAENDSDNLAVQVYGIGTGSVATTDSLVAATPQGRSRALQSAAEDSASGISNDDLKPYTVGQWSQCTCYQACVQGIKTRSVTCLSEACRAPRPATSEKCECEHCSHCSVLFNTFVFFLSFFTQGIIALLVWLSLLYMNSIEEAALVRLSWFQWFLGFFVKQLPPLARLLILLNAAQALMMLFQTWVPESIIEFQPDCNDVPALRFLSIFLGLVMLALLIIGRVTRSFTRMMPYLYRPNRSASPLPIRLFSKLQALLGP